MKPFTLKNPQDAALFTIGPEMWSPDNGVTWLKGRDGRYGIEFDKPLDGCLTVTAIDVADGSITLTLSRRND